MVTIIFATLGVLTTARHQATTQGRTFRAIPTTQTRMVQRIALEAIPTAGVKVTTAILTLTMTTSKADSHRDGPAASDAEVPRLLDTSLITRTSTPPATTIDVRPQRLALTSGDTPMRRYTTRRTETTRTLMDVARTGRPTGKVTTVIRTLRTLADTLSPR